MSGQVGYYEQFLISGNKKGYIIWKTKTRSLWSARQSRAKREFYISLIVERDTGKILELDCNTILEVTKQFVASMFVGKSLRTDVPLIEKEIRERYFALTQKPLIACMKDACNRYLTAIGENRGK